MVYRRSFDCGQAYAAGFCKAAAAAGVDPVTLVQKAPREDRAMSRISKAVSELGRSKGGSGSSLRKYIQMLRGSAIRGKQKPV